MRIGIDLGGTKIEGIVLAEDGEVLHRIRIDSPRDDYQQTIIRVGELTEELEAAAGNRLPVGIGTPGAISPGTGLMKNCNSTWLNGRPLKVDLEEHLQRPVAMENDANCFALSEACFGAGRNFRSVFGVILGTGTGGGIVIQRRLLNGPNSIAGEWGHNPLPHLDRDFEDEHRQCYCGRRNCVETYLSGPGLARTYARRGSSGRNAQQVAALAEQGEELAVETMNLYMRQLAAGLATVVNILDPEIIILGGGLSNIATLYHDVPERMKPYIFGNDFNTRLLAAKYGDASGARGAACLNS